MRQIIAYGPNVDLPVFPSAVILKTNNNLVLFRIPDLGSGMNQIIDEETFNKLTESGKIKKLDVPIEYKDGTWMAFEENGCHQFPASDQSSWRRNRASSLMEEGKTKMQSDPIAALKLFEISGRIAGIDVKDLVSDLEKSRQNPDESLADIYIRTNS